MKYLLCINAQKLDIIPEVYEGRIYERIQDTDKCYIVKTVKTSKRSQGYYKWRFREIKTCPLVELLFKCQPIN
jgi:hypothetical protein